MWTANHVRSLLSASSLISKPGPQLNPKLYKEAQGHIQRVSSAHFNAYVPAASGDSHFRNSHAPPLSPKSGAGKLGNRGETTKLSTVSAFKRTFGGTSVALLHPFSCARVVLQEEVIGESEMWGVAGWGGGEGGIVPVPHPHFCWGSSSSDWWAPLYSPQN